MPNVITMHRIGTSTQRRSIGTHREHHVDDDGKCLAPAIIIGIDGNAAAAIDIRDRALAWPIMPLRQGVV